MNGGEVIFHFKGNTDDVDKKTNNLAKDITSKLGSAGKTIGTAFLKGTAVATGALAGLVTAGVKSYADIEQSVGGVETLFKNSSDTVIKNAQKAYMTAGLSANTYMEQVTSFSASLLQSLGGDTQKAAEYADRAVVDMSDNANKMGTAIESIQNAYQGFAKQNYTMLDNLKLGYGGTKEEMARLIKDASKMTDIQKELNVSVKDGDMSFGNIVNAISVMQKKLDIAGTTSKEASETISGSLNSAKSAFQNFLAGTGGVDEVVTTFTTAGTNIVNAIKTMGPKILTGIVGIIQGIVPQLPELINSLLPSLINGAVGLMNSLVQQAPTIINTLMGLLPNLVSAIADMIPVLIKASITGFILIIQALAQQAPVLIPQIVDAILEIIPILIDNLPLFIKAGAQLLGGLIAGLVNSIPILLLRCSQIGISLVNAFRKIDLNDIGKNLLMGLVNGIRNAKNWVINKIKGICNEILGAIKNFFGVHSPSTEFAWIGKMNMTGLEEGMENMQPDLQKTINGMFDLSPNIYGSASTHFSPNVNVVVNNNMKQDPLGQMVNDIKTFSGGSKNDYNYVGA